MCKLCDEAHRWRFDVSCKGCYARALAVGLVDKKRDERYYRDAAEGLGIEWERVMRWAPAVAVRYPPLA